MSSATGSSSNKLRKGSERWSASSVVRLILNSNEGRFNHGDDSNRSGSLEVEIRALEELSSSSNTTRSNAVKHPSEYSGSSSDTGSSGASSTRQLEAASEEEPTGEGRRSRPSSDASRAKRSPHTEEEEEESLPVKENTGEVFRVRECIYTR